MELRKLGDEAVHDYNRQCRQQDHDDHQASACVAKLGTPCTAHGLHAILCGYNFLHGASHVSYTPHGKSSPMLS